MSRNALALVRPFLLVSAAALAAAGAAGCSSDDGAPVGADESNVDAFANPSNHGELVFGVPNGASFTDAQRFHAWTFKLTGPAELALTTELRTQNLDTVAYLYKKGDGGWGQNIASNDNFGGTLASRIAGRFDAGEYQLRVKARHISLRGDFAVLGQCTGQGCPTSSGECVAPAPDLPAASDATASCAGKLAAILTSPVGTAPASCGALAEAAKAYYADYFGGMGVLDDVGEDDFNVNVEHHPGKGTVVTVDIGGDEDGMDYVFDEEQRLILYYQHNQSPDFAWFCGEGPVAAVDPDEDCVSAMLGNRSYRAADVREGSGTHAAGAPSSVSPAVDAALGEYASTAGLAAGASIEYAFRSWTASYSSGAEVTLRAEGEAEVTYVVVGEPQWGMTIALATSGGATSFVCKEIR
ncbi:MAG: hypothetical protein KIS78_00880 [Labilithrix sp.]|nr:hypothetical protein [Labilithrix sp.]MCW5830993.1 hypothetical protein [Labilithrix sp.]